MKHHTQTLRYAIFGLVLCGSFATGGAFNRVLAQNNQDASARPKSGSRDPFERYRPVMKKNGKAATTVVPVPPIQARIDRYKAQKMAAINAQLPAPKPTTALLLSEVQVIGIFRTPRGYAAMVEATPIKLSYVVYPGESFYDGQLVAIEESNLVFRHETRWSDGRLEKTVENKPLRKPNAVSDSMTASKSASADSPVAASAKGGEERKAARDRQE